MISNWIDTYFVEKTPGSIGCLPHLLKRYPRANYLFLERHSLKIVLSLLNMRRKGEVAYENDMEKRKLFFGKLDDEYFTMGYEEFRAFGLCRNIEKQVQYKDQFLSQMTIRYEQLVTDIDPVLLELEKKFGIRANRDEAQKCLSRPSKSSKKNRYDIDALTEQKAIDYIIKACQLWNYKY